MSGAVKCDFRTNIRRYTSRNENFEYGYPHSNALLQFCLKLGRRKLYKVARHPTICDIIYDVKTFLTVYHRIYYRKFLTFSNQMLRYKSKCIRNVVYKFLTYTLSEMSTLSCVVANLCGTFLIEFQKCT